MFSPWCEAPFTRQTFTSFTLWGFREPLGSTENEGLFLGARAGFPQAMVLALASKCLHCLNSHNSRGRWMLLLSLINGREDCRHPDQASQSPAIACTPVVSVLPSWARLWANWEQERIISVCVTSAYNPAKGRKEDDQGLKKEYRNV